MSFWITSHVCANACTGIRSGASACSQEHDSAPWGGGGYKTNRLGEGEITSRGWGPWSYREGARDLWHVRVEGPPLGGHKGQCLRVRRAGICVRRVQVVHHRRLRPCARQRLRPHLRTTQTASPSEVALRATLIVLGVRGGIARMPDGSDQVAPGSSRPMSPQQALCWCDVRTWAAAANLAKGACRLTSGRSSSGGRARKQVTLSALGACASRYLRPTGVL